jgi:hypothetical protein
MAKQFANSLEPTMMSDDALYESYFARTGQFYQSDFYGLPKHYSGIWNDGMGGATPEEHAKKCMGGATPEEHAKKCMGGATPEEHTEKSHELKTPLWKTMRERLTASSLGSDGTTFYDSSGEASTWKVEWRQGKAKQPTLKIRSPGGHMKDPATRHEVSSLRRMYSLKSGDAEVTRREAMSKSL